MKNVFLYVPSFSVYIELILCCVRMEETLIYHPDVAPIKKATLRLIVTCFEECRRRKYYDKHTTIFQKTRMTK